VIERVVSLQATYAIAIATAAGKPTKIAHLPMAEDDCVGEDELPVPVPVPLPPELPADEVGPPKSVVVIVANVEPAALISNGSETARISEVLTRFVKAIW